MSDSLLVEIDARGVAQVKLNRPQVHNAFDDGLIAALTQTFGKLEVDDSLRLVVLSGEGKSFCAGGDLNWMRSMKDFSPSENITDSTRMAKMYQALRYFTKPLIAVVHGAALGGGSGLAAVADYVLAAEDAKFGFTEVRLGIIPAVISPYAIEKIGISAARAYFTSGMQFSAQTAKEIGLVHRVVAHDELHLAAEAMVKEFLKAAPGASMKAKALIEAVTPLAGDVKQVTKLTVEAIAEARVSDEGQEGMDALLHGRKAAWVVE